MSRFVQVDRDTAYLLPPSVQEWLPKEHPEGMDIPQELARREQRLARIEEAKAQIEAAAAQDYEQAQALFAAKQAARERRMNEGRRPPGPPPAPPSPAVDPKAQVNLTAADSRIMKVQDQGFEQCYNAQLAVDMDSRLIVAPGLTQEVNDKQQLIPALEKLRALPVIGIIKSVMKFRQFLLRALHYVTGEWGLVCLACNVKRMQGT